MVQNAEIPGFRKGKAPRAKVEEKLDKTKVYEEALKKIIPESYGKAVEEHKIHPIVQPKIELKEATEQKDWILRALTCEKPPVTLGEYTKAVKDLKASKANKSWTPGQEPKKEEKEENKKPTIDELLKALYESVTVQIPALLLEHEVNRLLSDLIDQTKKLGMSAEQYLSSTGRTAESIRKEYEEQAKRTLSLEFALEAVADKEGVLISDDDIDVVIKTAKTDEEKNALTAQRYYIASVLRRQKTIDFIAAL
jgi:trigger factor